MRRSLVRMVIDSSAVEGARGSRALLVATPLQRTHVRRQRHHGDPPPLRPSSWCASFAQGYLQHATSHDIARRSRWRTGGVRGVRGGGDSVYAGQSKRRVGVASLSCVWHGCAAQPVVRMSGV